METLLEIISAHAHQAHWIAFGALMLAGLNVPISEDLIIILGASLAANVIPENTYLLFVMIFLGCYLSDWVSYWIGRLLGRSLWNWTWFAKTVDRKRLEQIQTYYARYGFWTLLFGRFIPFGVRNCLFITAGMGQMSFPRFILSDGIACLSSNATLFYLAYTLAKNYQDLIANIKIFNIAVFTTFLLLLISRVWYKRRKKTSKEV
jgi:membrane protein DedA with SNARE-associated domain